MDAIEMSKNELLISERNMYLLDKIDSGTLESGMIKAYWREYHGNCVLLDLFTEEIVC